jgi:hypothetical protein
VSVRRQSTLPGAVAIPLPQVRNFKLFKRRDLASRLRSALDWRVSAHGMARLAVEHTLFEPQADFTVWTHRPGPRLTVTSEAGVSFGVLAQA